MVVWIDYNNDEFLSEKPSARWCPWAEKIVNIDDSEILNNIN